MPNGCARVFKSFVALSVSSALIVLSPGSLAHQAFAQSLAAARGVPTQGALTPVQAFSAHGGNAAIFTALGPSMNLKLDALPGVRSPQAPSVSKIAAVPAGSPAALEATAALRLVGRNAVAPAALAERSRAVSVPDLGFDRRTRICADAPRAEAAAEIQGFSEQVGSAIHSFGEIQRAGAEASHGLGVKLESILAGQPEGAADEGSFQPSAARFGDRQVERRLARPAGQEIGAAVRDYNQRFAVPEPQAAEQAPAPEPAGRGPAWPRFLAAGLALLPAVFIGWPLLAMMGPIGAINIALTLSLTALPFIPASAPKRLRQSPGFLLMAQGLAALAGMYLFFTIGPVQVGLLTQLNEFAMAALGILGGWGLERYLGKASEAGGSRISLDDPEFIGAFFAATAAGAAIGLTLLGLQGLLPLGVKALAYATSPLLLMHLPKWVGTGLLRALKGPAVSARHFHRFLSFWEGDTGFHKNMSKHARYWLDKSVWNGAWLSSIWAPTWGVQLAEVMLSGALGLALGVLRSPFNFAWGALAEAAPKSGLTRFFSAFVRTWTDVMEGRGVKARFDRAMAPFIEGMSASALPSGRPTVGAASNLLAAKTVQLAWLIGMVLLSPALLFYSLLKGIQHAFWGQTGSDDIRTP